MHVLLLHLNGLVRELAVLLDHQRLLLPELRIHQIFRSHVLRSLLIPMRSFCCLTRPAKLLFTFLLHLHTNLVILKIYI